METTKNITVIPARRRVGNTAKETEIPKLRVAAYCRVSTDSDEQATSYEVQVEHYTDISEKILNGSLPEFSLTMEYPARTPKNVRSSIV